MNEPRRYLGIGECIYCGVQEAGARLTDEHIMPDGLRGIHVLERASCDNCCKIINKLETSVLRGMLRPARIHLGMKSRKAKERISTLPITIVQKGRGTVDTKNIELPIHAHPYALGMPAYPQPRMLSGLRPKTLHRRFLWCQQGWFQADLPERLKRLSEQYGSTRVRTKIDPPHTEFMRMLAKIAHCALIRRLHDATFPKITYLLPDIILGRNANVASFVGGEWCCSIPRRSDPLETRVYFKQLYKADSTGRYAVVTIDIFGPFGMPRYHVVGGRVK